MFSKKHDLMFYSTKKKKILKSTKIFLCVLTYVSEMCHIKSSGSYESTLSHYEWQIIRRRNYNTPHIYILNHVNIMQKSHFCSVHLCVRLHWFSSHWLSDELVSTSSRGDAGHLSSLSEDWKIRRGRKERTVLCRTTAFLFGFGNWITILVCFPSERLCLLGLLGH